MQLQSTPQSVVRFGKLNSDQKKLARALNLNPKHVRNTDELRQQFLNKIEEAAKSYKPLPRTQSGEKKGLVEAFVDALAPVLDFAAHIYGKVFLPVGQAFGKVDAKPGATMTEDQEKAMERFFSSNVRRMLGYSDMASFEADMEKVVSKHADKLTNQAE